MDVWLSVSVLAGLVCSGVVIAALTRHIRQDGTQTSISNPSDIALLFDNGHLVDADNAIWPLLHNLPDAPVWSEVREALLPIVPSLPKNIETTDQKSSSTAPYVRVSSRGHTTRITLSPDPAQALDWFKARLNEVAVNRLSPAIDHSPTAIWSLDDDGHLLWGNKTFATLAKNRGGPTELANRISDLIEQPSSLATKRISLALDASHSRRWFEVSTQHTDTGILHFAAGVDAVVQAEEAQRNFVQTLSKTFANLTTGLAIFNRDRRLALFNPALIDLSGLSVDFLSGRPNLFEFFDKLREQQIMPEPKNYDNWRECMAKLVAAASDDRFRETWHLSDGQIFDVTGRPYPDGAVAFLINDITAEVSLTRGFRTELETMQSLIDAIDDAVVVFDQQGILTVCNVAYKEAWNVDPDTCITESTIVDATQDWKSVFHPNPIWPELREFVTRSTERASWDSELRSKDGREVICRVDPICYGSTLIRFCYQSRSRRIQSESEKDEFQIVSA